MERGTAARSGASLGREPDFVKLWIGRTISSFGSHISGTAIPLAALLALGATPAQMGLLTALGAAPVLLVGLVAGVWVDRLPHRPLLIAADLGRAALLLVIPLAFALRRLTIGQLELVVFLAGALTVVAEIAGQAILPSLLAPDHLIEGNSRLGASDSVAEIGGPSVAGVLVQWIGAPFAIALDALSFLVSALSLRLIHPPARRATPPPARGSLAGEAVEGLRLIAGQPVLRALAASGGTFTFFGNFIGTLYALFAIRALHLSAAAVGTLVGLGGVSALVGALVAGRVVRRFGLGRTLIGSLFCYGTLALLIPLAGGPPPLAYVCMALPQLLGDAFIAIHFIAQASLRQTTIPDRLLGRATASLRVIEGGLGPVGALLAGALATFVSPRLTLAIGVLGILLAPLWLVLSPVRALRQPPAHPSDTETLA